MIENQKLLSLIILQTCCMPLFVHANIDKNTLSLTSTTTWKEFTLKEKHNTRQDKWVWIGSITLKSNQAVKLEELKISWRGHKINYLNASLFNKKMNEELIPIEKNLICDGVWDKKNQQLVFNINEKVIATNNFHLVLSFPKKYEPLLKRGRFYISKNKSLTLSPLEKVKKTTQ